MAARRPLFLQQTFQSPLLGYLPLDAPDTGVTLQEIKTAASEHKFEPINPQAGFQAMKPPVEPPAETFPIHLYGGLPGPAPLLPLPRLPTLPGGPLPQLPGLAGGPRPILPLPVPGQTQPFPGLPVGPQARSPRLAEGAFQLATPTGPRTYYPPVVVPTPLRIDPVAPEAGGLGLTSGPPKFATTPRPLSPVRQPLAPVPAPIVPVGQLPEWQQPFQQEQPDIKIDPRTGRPLPYTNPSVFGTNIPPLPTGPAFTVPQYGTGIGGLAPLPVLPLGRPAPLPLGSGLTPLPTAPVAQPDAIREIALQIDPTRLTVATARAGTDGSYSLQELQTWASALQLPRSGTKKVLVERIQGKMRELGISG